MVMFMLLFASLTLQKGRSSFKKPPKNICHRDDRNAVEVANLEKMDDGLDFRIRWFETQTLDMCPYFNSVTRLADWREQFTPNGKNDQQFIMS